MEKVSSLEGEHVQASTELTLQISAYQNDDVAVQARRTA